MARDLSSLARSIDSVRNAMRRLSRPADAPALAEEGRALVHQMLLAGLPGHLLSHTLASLYDTLTQALIDLLARHRRLPPVAWCWLALGSEGRGEQTLVTDQDNALIFSATDAREADALRRHLLPFANEVNQCLAACGLILCPGGIMAGQPACCLSLDEWQARFLQWVRVPEPDALLNASIFFDFRPLCGDAQLAADLRRTVQQWIPEAAGFLYLMSVNAIQAEPPLNFRGELPAGHEVPDLKKYGSRIFVDVARIFALAHGVAVVDTLGRLGQAGLQAGLSRDELNSARTAFIHLQTLRFNHQSPSAEAWCQHERHLLRDCLQQAQRLQQRLKLNYQL